MMFTWYGLTENLEVVKSVHNVLRQAGYIVSWETSEQAFYRKINKEETSAFLIRVTDRFDTYKLCRYLTRDFPNSPIILIGEVNQLDVRKLLKCGATDFIDISATDSKIQETILSVEEEMKKYKSKPTFTSNNENGKVISICGTRGGVGKTSLAINLAAAISKQKKQVIVVDLNLQFGDVAMSLDIRPKETIYEWVKEAYNKDNDMIEQFTLKSNDYLHIVASPTRPEFSEVITEEHINLLIELLRKKYEYIIIDLPNYLTDTSLAALEKTDDIYLVVTKDLPTLRNAKLYLDTLESLNLTNKISILMNCNQKIRGIDDELITKILGLSVTYKLPYVNKAILTSINIGKPLFLVNRRHKYSKSIWKIVKQLNQSAPSITKKTVIHRLSKAGRKVSCLF